MSPPPRVPFRDMAKAHVDTARALLAGDGPSLRHACLELRLAIEALTYDELQTYGDEIDPAIDQAEAEWHPRKILAGLRAYDPIGEATLVATMKIRREGEEWETRGEIRQPRFSPDWASKAHAALSHFLHQVTLPKMRAGEGLDETKLRRKAGEVIEALDPILAEPFTDIRQGFRFGYDCPACGEGITVALTALILTSQARTTCAGCGVVWRAEGDGEGGVRFSRL
jgi:hypothetical protein